MGAIFKKKLSPVMKIDELTLEMLWRNGFQVILFYNSVWAKKQYNFWPHSAISNQWPNVYEPDELVDYFELNYNNERSNSTYHVAQGILTPTSSYILSNLSSSLKNLSKTANEAFLPWI